MGGGGLGCRGGVGVGKCKLIVNGEKGGEMK